MADSFRKWVSALVKERYGKYANLAEKVGISESGLLRGAKRGTMDPENLLKIARAVEEDPARVLRMADKNELADLITQLFGPSNPLSVPEREMVERWRRLSAHGRSVVGDVLRKYSGDPVEADSEEGADPPAARRRSGHTGASAHR